MRRTLCTLSICCLALLALPLGAAAATTPVTAGLVVGTPGAYQFSIGAAGTCTASTTCSSGTTISCDGTTSCTNDNGVSVTCSGSSGSCTVQCSEVDAAAACRDDCDAAYDYCIVLQGCSYPLTRTCAQPCIQERVSCNFSCPNASTSCSA